uniref:C2H2-type domain-containing protein n=1 Tax=Caenorhabditis japonica TaxID=281687 RepID=A0A8R1DXV7_CAEJA
MITMWNGSQEYSWSSENDFFDSYNLDSRVVALPDEYCHPPPDNQGPCVFATLRNVFSQPTNEDYELVYDELPDGPFFTHSPEQNQLHIPEDREEEEDDGDDGTEQKEVYPCTECNKKYTSERRLKHHLVMHRNREAYKCPTCGFCYQSPDSLRRHMKKVIECNPELNGTAVATGTENQEAPISEP